MRAALFALCVAASTTVGLGSDTDAVVAEGGAHRNTTVAGQQAAAPATQHKASEQEVLRSALSKETADAKSSSDTLSKLREQLAALQGEAPSVQESSPQLSPGDAVPEAAEVDYRRTLDEKLGLEHVTKLVLERVMQRAQTEGASGVAATTAASTAPPPSKPAYQAAAAAASQASEAAAVASAAPAGASPQVVEPESAPPASDPAAAVEQASESAGTVQGSPPAEPESVAPPPAAATVPAVEEDSQQVTDPTRPVALPCTAHTSADARFSDEERQIYEAHVAQTRQTATALTQQAEDAAESLASELSKLATQIPR